MLQRKLLIDFVSSLLESKGYTIFITHGCFDLAAKKKELLLIKILSNIDGFLEEHAKSIKTVSHFLSAYPFVVSLVTNRGPLIDDIIYFRFDIPVVTPETFRKILDKKEIKELSAKGRHTVEIDVNVLKERRAKLDLSLKRLADLVGISKKAMYEIENKRVNPTKETLKKLENILKVKLSKTFTPKVPDKLVLKPKDRFEHLVSIKLKKLGVDNSVVYSTNFNLVGKKTFSVISLIQKRIKSKKTYEIKKLSEFFSTRAFVVCKSKIDADIPLLTETDLRRIKTPEEFEEAIKP